MKRFHLVSVFIVALLSPLTAIAKDEAILWKNIDVWSIYADPTLGNACYIATMYNNGTLLRLGFDFTTNPKSVYLGLSNEKWKSLDSGKEYPIKIQFDNNPVWEATATAQDMGDFTILVARTTDVNFVNEFSKKLTIRAEFNGREIVNLRLDRSAKAISEMLNCQAAVNQATSTGANAKPKEDPFEQPAQVKNPSDPFEL